MTAGAMNAGFAQAAAPQDVAPHYGGRRAAEQDWSVIIDQLEFLAGVGKGDLVQLMTSEQTEVRVLEERQLLFEQNTQLSTIFYVLEGSLYQSRITDQGAGQRMSLRTTLQKGRIAGLYDMLYRLPHSATVRAVETTTVLAINAMEIRRLLTTYPNLRSQITPADVIERLRTIPFFAEQNIIEICSLAAACVTQEYSKGDILYNAGEELEDFYIIHQGQIHLTGGENADYWLGNGNVLGIGEIGTSPYLPIIAGYTAKVTAPTTLFVVKRETLLGVMAVDPAVTGRKLREEITDTVNRLTVFREYSDVNKRKLMGYMSYFSVADKRRLLMQQDELADSFWVLMPSRKATVSAVDGGGKAIANTQLSGPTYFNELSLRVLRPVKSTVDAEVNSQWLRLHRRDFQVFIKETDKDLLRNLVLSEDLKAKDDDKERKRYPWLQDGEEVRIDKRRHWIALARLAMIPFSATLVLVIVWLATLFLFTPLLWVQLAIFGPLLLGLIGVWAWAIADYLNDYLIVTNLRVMNQEKVVLFSETRKSASLSQVQNVDVNKNFLGNLLGFGDVTIQTSGATGAILFDRVSNGEAIRDAINSMRGRQNDHRDAGEKIVIQQVLEERLGIGLDIPARVRTDDEEVLRDQGEGSRLLNLIGISKNEKSEKWTETQKIVWRKHWFILGGHIMPALILFLVSFIFIVATVVGAAAIPLLRNFSDVIIATLAIPAVLVWLGSIAWGGWIWADWRNDTYEIDGNEVFDVEKTPLFTGENKRSARLGDIENVQLDIPSPIHYILNFGNVVLQTAAADGNLTFDHVPNPRAVAEEIRRRIARFEREQEEKQARKNAADLPVWFETYNRLDSNQSNEEGDAGARYA